jgi:hypothetical protein
MKFGRPQIKNPTPASILFWVRVWTISGGVVLTSMESIPFHTVSGVFESTMKWFIGLTITLSNVLAPLFGVEIKTGTVPAEKVTGIEEEKTPVETGVNEANQNVKNE